MKLVDREAAVRSLLLNRLMVLMLAGTVWCVVVLVRLFYLQGVEVENYASKSESQQSGFLMVRPQRGDILDRRLGELAKTVRADSVFAHPHQIDDPVKTAEVLAEKLEMASGSLLQKLTQNEKFVYLKRQLSPGFVQSILAAALPGVHTQEESRRVYPSRELASHVLGFVGIDGVGLGGLEYYYDEELKAEGGRVDFRFDAKRKPYLQKSELQKRSEGNDLILTIDQSLQHIVESVLRETVEAKQAKEGSAILMNPHTGEILAMAKWPTFNPNNLGDGPTSLRNSNISDLYEPGSTFKIITIASLLEEGLGDPEEIIDCRAGTARLAGKVYREAKHSYGFLSLSQVVVKSSNIGTVKLALRLGEEKLHDYVRRFGFGDKTGIDLPGEEPGLFRPTSQWSRISIGAISIGQEIGVTPLQMIRAGSSLANGGFLVRPFIVQKILAPNGDLVRETRSERVRILKQETVDQMNEILSAVVTSGTGRSARLRGYTAAGKTGTAQKIVDGRYSKSKYVASFLGFAPATDPALIALIVVDEPKGVPYGGYVAAPAFKEIMERALIHLDIPKDLPEDDEALSGFDLALSDSPMEPAFVSGVSDFEDPTMAGDLQEAVLSILQEGEVGQTPGTESQTVVVELGTGSLPNFTGMSLREVASRAVELDLKLKISGTGKAVGQRPSPGRRVTKGMVCEVFFSKSGQQVDAASQIAFKNSSVADSQRRKP